MMNVENLRKELEGSFKELKAGKLNVKQAKEISQMSSQILSTAKMQLDYNKFQKNGKKIKFLEAN